MFKNKEPFDPKYGVACVPEAYKLFNFIKSISKLCSVWYLLKVTKIRVEYIGRQFWGHVPPPPPPHRKHVRGRVVSAPLMIQVMSTQTVKHLKHFKLSITFLLDALILV